jgi:arginase
MATGKVAAFAVVSVYFYGRSDERDLSSGVELVRGGLAAWRRYCRH